MRCTRVSDLMPTWKLPPEGTLRFPAVPGGTQEARCSSPRLGGWLLDVRSAGSDGPFPSDSPRGPIVRARPLSGHGQKAVSRFGVAEVSTRSCSGSHDGAVASATGASSAGLRRCIDADGQHRERARGMSVVPRFAASDRSACVVRSPLVARIGWTTLVGFVVVGCRRLAMRFVGGGAGRCWARSVGGIGRGRATRVAASRGGHRSLDACVSSSLTAGVSHEWSSVTRSVVVAALVGVRDARRLVGVTWRRRVRRCAADGGGGVGAGVGVRRARPAGCCSERSSLVVRWCWHDVSALVRWGLQPTTVPFAVALLGGWVVGLCIG